MNVVIRRAVESDLPPMVEMLHELLSLEVDFEPDRGKQMRALRMILENPGCLLLAAEHEGNIVGTCSVQTLISTAERGLSAMIEDIVVSRESANAESGAVFLRRRSGGRAGVASPGCSFFAMRRICLPGNSMKKQAGTGLT